MLYIFKITIYIMEIKKIERIPDEKIIYDDSLTNEEKKKLFLITFENYNNYGIERSFVYTESKAIKLLNNETLNNKGMLLFFVFAGIMLLYLIKKYYFFKYEYIFLSSILVPLLIINMFYCIYKKNNTIKRQIEFIKNYNID